MLKFSVIHPADLTPEDRRYWFDWQTKSSILGSPFISYQMAILAAEVTGDVHVLKCSENGEPVAFLTYWEPITGIGIPPVWPASDFQAVVHAQGFDVRPEVLLEAARLDVLYFDNLLTATTKFFLPFHSSLQSPAYHVDLGLIEGSFEQSLSSNYKGNLRKYRNRTKRELTTSPKLEINSLDLNAMRTMLQWKDIQHFETGNLTALLENCTEGFHQIFSYLPEFYRRMLLMNDATMRGQFCTFSKDNTLLAAEFAVVFNTTFHFWIKAYNKQFASLGLGSELELQIIEAIKSAGNIRIVDYGPGAEEYKSRVSNCSTSVVPAVVFDLKKFTGSDIEKKIVSALHKICGKNFTQYSINRLRQVICESTHNAKRLLPNQT